MSRNEIFRTLKELGMENDEIDTIMHLYDDQCLSQCFPILRRYKNVLLSKMYESQDKVDMFDDFIYRLKKEEKEN